MELTETAVTPSIHAWVIGRDAGLCHEIRTCLFEIPDVSYGGTYPTWHQLLRRIEDNEDGAPQVLLIDGESVGGFHWLPAFKEMARGVVGIALISHFNHETPGSLFSSGISGFLTKPFSSGDILAAAMAATSGGIFVSSGMKDHLARFLTTSFVEARTYGLTRREEEILEALVDGYQVKEIADQLSISFYTVETHLKNIRAKLGVGSSVAAVSKALKEHFFG